MLVKKVPYQEVRHLIRVGDPIGCQHSGFLGRAIQLFRPGATGAKWTHVSTVVEDTTTGDRVDLVEAVRKGMQPAHLSESYAAAHGTLFWFPTNCTGEQRKEIQRLAYGVVEAGVKYDFWSTIKAAVFPIYCNPGRLNCSEAWWHFLTAAGRYPIRLNKFGRMLAPAPSDVPVWAGVCGYFELVMAV